MDDDEVRKNIRKKYAQLLAVKAKNGGVLGANLVTGGLYAVSEVKEVPPQAVAASLGCGNPTALATLYSGETVLDLGSGAGLDVLLSARRVGPLGQVYGLDMTDEMLVEANSNKDKAGVTNVEFLKGQMEAIPLSEAIIDVVISNCAINLAVDKDQVFREIYRVLKPGGRMAVADIVTTKFLPDDIRQSLLAWAGCLAGVLVDSEYKEKLAQAGFENIEFEITRTYDLMNPVVQTLVQGLANSDPINWDGSLVSIFIRARKPARSK